MSKENHPSHHHQTTLARVLILIVFAILCAGDFAFWLFSRYPGNPFPAMPGLVIGCALASTVMIGAIWIRKSLARTALVVFLWIMMFVFSMPGLIMMSDRSTAQMGPLKMLAAGLGAYLIANIILIVADPIHRLGASRGVRARGPAGHH